MKVKDIILDVCKLLGYNELIIYLDNNSNLEIDNSSLQDLNLIELAVNMTNNIIASNYIELLDDCDIVPKDNKVLFSQITTKNIIEIKNVKDMNGCEVDYSINSSGIVLDSSSTKLKITYSYFPSSVTVNDDIDYYLKMNSLLFAEGVVSQYLFLKGDTENACAWDKRFKNSLFVLLRPKRNIIMPSKRW